MLFIVFVVLKNFFKFFMTIQTHSTASAPRNNPKKHDHGEIFEADYRVIDE